MAEVKGTSVTLHAHGDGSYTTQEHGHPQEYSHSGKDLGRVEHPSFGHALMHIAKHHGPEGEHMHIHGHAEGYTSHNVKEDGDVEGPHEHERIGALKSHVADCMEEE